MRPLARLALLAGVLTAITFVATPRSEINGGLGSDGVQYGEMVRHFRGEPSAPVSSLAAYRVAAPAVVAWSGLDVRDGFLALDVVASFASLVLLGALLTGLGVRERLAAVGMLWWAVLPAGLRFFLYLPVLTDAAGTAFTLALVLAAERRRPALFALLLPVAVLTREPLLALAPLLLIAERSRGLARASVVTALATAPAAAVLLLIRVFPPMPVDPVISLPTAALIHTLVLAFNVDGDTWRYLGALPTASERC